MRKRVMTALAAAAAVSLIVCAQASADEIKVWVADNTVEFTKAQTEAFKEAYPDFSPAFPLPCRNATRYDQKEKAP